MNKEEKTRTAAQNRSLHAYCTEVARVASEKNLTMQMLLAQTIEIEPTLEGIKSIFQQIGKKAYGKPHTSDFTTTEMTAAYETVNRWLAEPKIQMHVPWPSQESQALEHITPPYEKL